MFFFNFVGSTHKLKNDIMKNLKLSILLFAALFLSISTAKGQSWSSPQALTFSEANKSNLYLDFYREYGTGDHWLLLWEQPADSGSTAIYCQLDLLNAEPVLLLSDSLVQYRNPQCCYDGNYSDTLYYVFYEKVYEGNSQLCYIKLAADGGHSNPMVFAENETGDFQYHLESEKIAWVSNNFLLVSFVGYPGGNIGFSPPDTLMQGNISDVIINNNEVFCIINDGEQDKVMYVEWEDYTWNLPLELASGTEIKSLETVNSAHYIYETYPLIAWTFRESDLWHITTSQVGWSSHYLDTLNVSDSVPFDFGIFCEEVMTDPYDGPFCAAFAKHDSLGSGIFVMDGNLGSETPFRLSDPGHECKHPVIVQGESLNYGYYVYIVWEAKVDGFQQFYYSRALFYWGSVEENEADAQYTVFPNPANDFIQIQNKLALEIEIRIFDISGKLILQTSENETEISFQTQSWPRGVYMVSIINGEQQFSRKVVLE